MAKPKAIGPRDAMGGREVEAPPILPHQRAQGTSQGTTTYTRKFQPPPEAPAGVNTGRGMTPDEVSKFNKVNDYCKGGKVIATRKV